MKIEELIEISDEIDGIFHDYGYSVDHGILSHYLFKIIKESYPNSDIELDSPDLGPILGSLGLRPLPEIV